MVATVTPVNNASASVEYFARDGHSAQRAHRRASSWHGDGARLLGLSGSVATTTFDRVLRGHVPGTDIVLGRIRGGRRQHRPGIDVTLSAPKSASVVALVLGRREVLHAHDRAVAATLPVVQSLLEMRRYNPETRGQDRVSAPAMVAAAFRHVTSRALDPQLHTHCVVANVTWDGGRWRGLDLDRLSGARRLIGAVYRNALATELRRLGFDLAPTMIGAVPGFEIAGCHPVVIRAFSSRSAELLEYLVAHDLPYTARAVQVAALATRPDKEEKTVAELVRQWRLRLDELGVSRNRVVERARAGPPPPSSALEIVAQAAAQAERRAGAFGARDLLTLAVASSRGLQPTDKIQAAVSQLVRDRHLVETHRHRVARAFVTDHTLRAERALAGLVRDAVGASESLADGALSSVPQDDAATDRHDAIQHILVSHDRIVGMQHDAGKERDAVLREVARRCGRRKIVGLYVTGAGGKQLAERTGITCWSLHELLRAHRDIADGVAEPDRLAALRRRFGGALLVVDDALAVSAREMRDLLRVASALRVGRVVLLADRRDLRGVDARQPWRLLRDAGMSIVLMDGSTRAATRNVRWAAATVIGEDPAFRFEEFGVGVHQIAFADLGETAAHIWLRLSEDGRKGTRIVAQTGPLSDRITTAICAGLEAEGVLHGPTMQIQTLVDRRLTSAQKADVRNYSEGDVLVFHTDYLNYRVQRDDVCMVIAVEPSGDRPLIRLAHQDGTSRHLRPRGNIRAAFRVYTVADVSLRAGDRIRWTRGHDRLGLSAGQEAKVLAIGPKRIRLKTHEPEPLVLDREHGQLRHLALAYVAAAEDTDGETSGDMLGVIDSGLAGSVTQVLSVLEANLAGERLALTDSIEGVVAACRDARRQLTVAVTPTAQAPHTTPDPHIALPHPGTGMSATLRKGLPREWWNERRRREAQRLAARGRHLDEWQNDCDDLLAAARRAGVHPSAYPEHAELGTRLEELAKDRADWPVALRERVDAAAASHRADADLPHRLQECAQALDRTLALRGALYLAGIDDQVATDGPTSYAAYPHWRSGLDTALAAATQALLEPDVRLRMPGGENERLQAAACAARQLVAYDDASIASREAGRRANALCAKWDALPEAGAKAGKGTVEQTLSDGLVERMRQLREHPALPSPHSRQLLERMKKYADRALRDWERSRDRLEDEAPGPALHAHADLPAAIAEARRVAALPGLQDTAREQLSEWAVKQQAAVDVLREARAATAGLHQTLTELADAPRKAMDRLYETLSARRDSAAELLDSPPVVPGVAEGLREFREKADSALRVRARYTSWRDARQEHETHCRKQDIDPLTVSGYEPALADARQVVAAADAPTALCTEVQSWLDDIEPPLAAAERSASCRAQVDATIAELGDASLDELAACYAALEALKEQATAHRDDPILVPSERQHAGDAVDKVTEHLRGYAMYREWERFGEEKAAAKQAFRPSAREAERVHILRARALAQRSFVAPAHREVARQAVAMDDLRIKVIDTCHAIRREPSSEKANSLCDELQRHRAAVGDVPDQPAPVTGHARRLRDAAARADAILQDRKRFIALRDDWDAHARRQRRRSRSPLLGGDAKRLAERAEALTESPTLASGYREWLRGIVDNVAYPGWRREWLEHEERCSENDEHKFRTGDYARLLEVASELDRNGRLPDQARQFLTTLLDDRDQFDDVQAVYDEVWEQWTQRGRRSADEAADAPEPAALVEDMEWLLAHHRHHLTPEQIGDLRDAVRKGGPGVQPPGPSP